MLVYSGEFSRNMWNFLRQNMQENLRNLAKYAAHICCICRIYAAYAAYMRHIFPHISGICKFEWRSIIIVITNRPFLHSFDIFNFNLFNVYCNYWKLFADKIFSGLKTTLDKEHAEKCDRICGNMWHICEFLHMRHTRHNFRICNFENAGGRLPIGGL